MDEKHRGVKSTDEGEKRISQKGNLKKIHMQHFSLDTENMTKYGKADRPGSRQADRQAGREEEGDCGVQCGNPSSCPEQNRPPERTARCYLSRRG